MSDVRADLAEAWIQSLYGSHATVALLAGDASFRRYFRVWTGEVSAVLMDAPPEKEDVFPFLEKRAWLQNAGVRVPKLLAQDVSQGFLLLEDLGDMTWAQALHKGVAVEPLLEDALAQLHTMQSSQSPCALPVFDMTRMQQECDLYLDWYLPRVMNIEVSAQERQAFRQGLRPSLEKLTALPQVPVHLDFHSRNLMLPDGELPLAVIDFQDAVMGPVTYDVASLLYDCYQDYPEGMRRHWSEQFYQQLPRDMQQAFAHVDEWHQAVRLTAFQRHIKVLGIFARLAYRDEKQKFLQEIPLTRRHVWDELEVLKQPSCVTHWLDREKEEGMHTL